MSSETESAGSLESYLAATQAVVASGRWLDRQLATDGGAVAVEQALQRLEQDITAQEGGAARYERSMFEGEGDDGAAPAAPPPEELNEHLLAHALTELQTADVLVALAERAGEGERAPQPVPAASPGRSLDALDATVRSIERRSEEASRFSGGDEPEPVLDAAEGTRRLDRRAGEVLDGFVASADGAVREVVERLKELDRAGVAKAIQDAGTALKPQLRKIGRLAALAVRKVERAVDVLLRLLPGDGATALRRPLERFWTAVAGPDPLRTALQRAFDVPEANDHRRRVASRADLRPEALAAALAGMEPLAAGFDRSMALVKRVANTLAVVSAALVAISAVSATIAGVVPTAGLVVLGAYVLLLGIVIAIGRDYTDSGRTLGRVRGVRTLLTEAEGA